jgi:exodeoxyribonuclease V gamma subunit
VAFHLHRATRSDALADELASVLARPLADPFAAEVVVVPARGVERWLSQRLSHHLGAGARGDGVCAGVDFRSPSSLVAEILGTSEDDPWSPDALAWPLLEVIDESLGEPWAATLASHLGRDRSGEEGDLRQGRRWAVARRIAGLFASYARQRPAVVEAWGAGRDLDGAGGAVPDDLAWQPHLWRGLVAHVRVEPPDARQRRTVEMLRARPGEVDLPDRVSLFGHTRLPVTEIELLEALGSHRDVHLFLPHPSPALWAALAAELGGDAGGGPGARRTGDRRTAAQRPVRRDADDSHERAGHPLLASLGRDVRELQRLLPPPDAPRIPAEESHLGAEESQMANRTDPSPAIRDSSAAIGDPSAGVLGWLQGDLANNGAGAGGARTWRPEDRSVQVHACHGASRQVEVLRDVVLGLLADDPTLEPRDIVVMCPDIETYAPLIQAGFGLAEVVGVDGHPAHQLRVSLADRALTQTNPLLAVASRLLDLAGGRAGASEVLDLAHAEPVRRRFRFTDDDLDQLTRWVQESGIRWAFDAEHRADFGLADFVQNTWRFGLDRVLAGVALSDDAGTWLGATLPLDDVGSGQVDLAGRLAEYVARLSAVTDRLVGSPPLRHWMSTLADGVDALSEVSAADSWQSGQVQRELSRVVADAGPLAETSLRLPDVRALLAARLAGRPTRANFRTGTLTVCTMVPMRSVPHRVICLLGLDDGVFPRAGIVDGDDLLARTPLTGERDARSEDRQLLLDAIMAATEKLVITYTGADEISGQPRPPAVPLGEVLDALDAVATTGDGSGLAAALTIHHPLQPFDQRAVVSGALVPGTPFTFDHASVRGARAAAGPRHPPTPFLPGPLLAPPREDVPLDALAAFLKHPVRDFLRSRLDLALPYDEPPVTDRLPVEIDQLAQWGVGDRVLTDLLAGVDPARAREQEWRRGVLPPGRLGWRMLGDLVHRAIPLARAALALRTRPASAVDVDVDLGSGRRLRGTVPGVYGDRLVPVSYSRLGATHRLQSWVRVLALTASDPDRNWTAHTVGRPTNSRSRDDHATSLLGPVDDYTAREVLGRLVDLRDRGLVEPLPLPIKASYSYARLRRTEATTAEAVRKAGYDWDDARFPGECSDAAQVRAWGQGAALPGLDTAPRPGEEHPGEATRFGALALALWSPLLSAEQGSW